MMRALAASTSNETVPLARPSVALALAGLVTLAALYLTAPHLIGLPVLALAFGATLFVRLRLPRSALLVWPLRLVLFTLLIIASPERRFEAKMWYLRPEYSSLFGYLCAAELAIQCWQKRKTAPSGEIMVLTALIFASATNTPDRRAVQWLAPLYIVLTVMALRGFRPGAKAALKPAGVWPRRIGRWGTIGIALAVGFAIAAAFTEYGAQLERWTIAPWTSRQNATSLSVMGSPVLGRSFNSKGSPARVLLVDGLAGEAHLRGLSYETYTGGRWGPAAQERRFRLIGRAELKSESAGRIWHIRRLADDLSLLYVPLNAAGIVPMGETRAQCDREHGRALQTVPEEETTGYFYDVALGRPDQQGPLCGDMSSSYRDACLQVPGEVDARVRQLAMEIAGTGTPRQRIEAVEQYLLKNHKYSLTIQPGPGDRVSDFLLNKRDGHCMYFASSAVILLRCVGVPARYVNGFYAHEAAGANATVVRQRDAHAWAECWIDGTGWVTIDATPDAGRPDQTQPAVGFWRRAWEWVGDVVGDIGGWLMKLGWRQILLAVAMVIAGTLLVRWLRRTRTAKRRVGKSEAYAQNIAELAALAAAFMKLLKQAGQPCAAHRTWAEHMTGVDGMPLDVDAARRFVASYAAARFGRDEPDQAIAELQRLLREITPRSSDH